MPCGQTNVKAAFSCGIALAVLSLLSCANYADTASIVIGIIGAMMHGILIFGAQERNSTAILVWIVLACIVNGCYGWMAGSLIYLIAKSPAVHAIVYVYFFLFIGDIFFLLWTILVAKKARKEIEAGEF